MRGVEARPNHAIQVLSEQEKAPQVFPDARFFVAAVDCPEFTHRWPETKDLNGNSLGYTLPPDYRIRVLLTMTEATHPEIDLKTGPGLKLAADALRVPLDDARDVWKFNRRTWEDDLDTALKLAKQFKKEHEQKVAQKGILLAIQKREEQLTDSAQEIAAALQQKYPPKPKQGGVPAGKNPRHVANLELITRLRNQGYGDKEIHGKTGLPFSTIESNAKKLLQLGFINRIPASKRKHSVEKRVRNVFSLNRERLLKALHERLAQNPGDPKSQRMVDIYKDFFEKNGKATTLLHLEKLADIEVLRNQRKTNVEIAAALSMPLPTVDTYSMELRQAGRIEKLPSIKPISKEALAIRSAFQNMLQEFEASNNGKPPFTQWAKKIGVSRTRVRQLYSEEKGTRPKPKSLS